MAWEPKKPLSIETVEVAAPKAGEVRIKVIIVDVTEGQGLGLSTVHHIK